METLHRQAWRRHAALPWLCFFFSAAIAFPQKAEQSLNNYYRFPLSLALEYQNLSPFSGYGSPFNVFDLSAALRWPLPARPMLQPMLKLGLMRFDSQDPVEPLKWDHSHWYGALGLELAHRFAKNFELGGEGLVGFSEAFFPDLLPAEGTVGTSNLFFEAGGRIALNPSFNLSIDVHPSVKYLLSLSPLKDFDGFIFGIGFAATYRFGQDPDAPGALIRSIRFDRISIPPVFAAMQSYYLKHPIGRITLTNTEKQAVTEVTVFFQQSGYMDSATQAAYLPELRAGESRDIELLASFNQEVFRTEGVTPLSGEVGVTYKYRGRAVEQRQPVSYDLHDKTAITWDDDRKVAAFITSADSALRNYASFIRQACKERSVATINGPLQLAMQVFQALGEIGCLYQADPALPFLKARENPAVVDSVSLPRDTLRRITGDCDDLTVLFCSLLETAGTDTAFITVPGHIYAAFNTQAAGRDFSKIHADRGMTINFDDSLWIPVEITLIGKTGFMEAWRKGAEEWKAYEESPEKRGFYKTRACQELYRPVGLKETDLGLQYGRKENISLGFQRDLDRLAGDELTAYASLARQSRKKEDLNRLGIRCAEFARYDQAQEAFEQALKLDARFLSARINLGNLRFCRQDYPGALNLFQAAYQDLEQRGGERSELALKVLVNISRSYYQMGQYGESQDCLSRAKTIDAAKVQQLAFAAQGGSGEERAAAEQENRYGILFVEED